MTCAFRRLVAGATGVVALAAFLSPALAADVVRVVPPPPVAVVPVPAFTWTGCHVGIEGGWAFGHKEFDDVDPLELFAPTGERFDLKVDGGLIGGRVGCDKEFHNNLVFGVQGAGFWRNIKGSADNAFSTQFGTRDGTVEARVQWLTNITARLGYGPGNHLWYVKGGAAFMGERDRTFGNVTCTDARCIGDGDFDLAGDAVHPGWTIGAGLEWAFVPALSLSLEYNFYKFSTRRVALYGQGGLLGPFGVPVDVTPTLNTVTAALNYRF